MQKTLLKEAEKYAKQNYRRRMWHTFVRVMACVMAFFTTYALIVPALTLEKTPSGSEEHTHSESCYEKVTSGSGAALVCTYESLGVHVHTSACYNEENQLICGQADYLVHAHNDDCVDGNGEIVCRIPEVSAHEHTDSCYSVPEAEPVEPETTAAETAHSHGDECYAVRRGELICPLVETEGHTHGTACRESTPPCELIEQEAHQHTDACYEMASDLICGLEEGAAPAADTGDRKAAETERELICTEPAAQVHVHSEDCFLKAAEDKEPLTCTLAEDETHTHGVTCYGTWKLICGMGEVSRSDPEADVETEAQWMAAFADVTRTGEWGKDLLAIAMSQLGYQESTRNFEVMEDGATIKGYTRYGDWYGMPYGDWCAMFVSFCLHYADIPRDKIPFEASCPEWIEALQNPDCDLYRPAGEYTPVPGDLIFFDWEEDGVSDHMGIVAEVIPASAKIKTIEGDCGNQVAEQEYDMGDAAILGYAKMPENSLAYRCGTEEHAHDAACADENGELVCGLEEHKHSIACTLPRELGEEALSAVAETIGLIDALPTYDEIVAKLDEFYEADDAEGEEAYMTEVFAQVEAAYRAYMALDESLREYVANADKLMELEFIWSRITLEEPVRSYDLEGGEYLFPAEEGEFPRYYQTSSYAIYYAACTFVLIPASELEDGQWTPAPVDWNGSANANYIVAYCADDCTAISPTDSDTYNAYSIDNSRFTTDLQQRKIAAIIGNSYPFLTLAEARAVMAAAGVEGAQQCTEHELITATQWAVWATVETVEAGKLVESDLEDYDFSADPLLNPLEAGPAMDDAVKARIVNVKNWLCSLAEPEKLAVTDYDPVITANEDGTFNLSITVNLNRAIEPDEHVQFNLLAGSRSTAVTELPAGKKSFVISAENLTEAEVANAKVNLNISGEHMQAYFFDSQHFQDMVSGKWEDYSEDITVELGLEVIDVAVSKVWAEENTAIESIDVQLLADGKPYGAPVTLSKNNDWHYIWEDLKRYNVTEINKAPEDRTEIEYSIMEVPLPGYYSSDLAVNNFNGVAKVKQWKEVTAFDGAGQYVFVSDAGALSAEYLANPPANWGNNYYIALTPVDLSSASLTEKSVIWNVAVDNKQYTIESKKYGGWYISESNHQLLSVDYASGFTFTDGTICHTTNNGKKYYFDGFYSGGYQAYTTNKNDAMRFRLYKLVNMRLPSADKNFVLTNTKIQQGTPTVNISVTKEWAGRPDGMYPESATVQLMQTDVFDGTEKPYGYPVVLNAENNWTYTWSEMPKYILKDGSNNFIQYSVEEVDIAENYECTLTATEKEDGYEFALTNTWVFQAVNVELQKTGSDTSQLLPGAEFDLYLMTDQAEDPIPGTQNVRGLRIDHIVVGDTGKVTMNLIPEETYYLVETKAPENYILLDQAIGFTVSKTDSSVKLNLLADTDHAEVLNDPAPVLKIQNQCYYELPETGGAGTTAYMMAGLMLILFSMAYLVSIPKANVRKKF